MATPNKIRLKTNKKCKSAIVFMYAYEQAPLDEETISLTSFTSGDKLYAFIRGFHDLKAYQFIFLPNKCIHSLKNSLTKALHLSIVTILTIFI